MTSQNYFSCFTSFIISDCCAGLSCTRYSEYSQYLVVYFSHNEHFLIRISFPFSANDKRLRNVNGVTNPNGGAVPPPVQRTPLSDPDMDNESLDNSRNSENEGYMREVKAIIGGVLGKENKTVTPPKNLIFVFAKLEQITISLFVDFSHFLFNFRFLGWRGRPRNRISSSRFDPTPLLQRRWRQR